MLNSYPFFPFQQQLAVSYYRFSIQSLKRKKYLWGGEEMLKSVLCSLIATHFKP